MHMQGLYTVFFIKRIAIFF